MVSAAPTERPDMKPDPPSPRAAARPGRRPRTGATAFGATAFGATAFGAAVSLLAASGCGALSSAHTLVDRAGTLSSIAAQVGRAKKLTYQATYAVSGGTTVTVAQDPPRSAFVTANGRLVSTGGSVYLCDTSAVPATCQRSSAADTTQDPAAALGASGFVSSDVALGVLTAAMVVPKVTVTKSTRTIAGQSATCVSVTGLDAAVGALGAIDPSESAPATPTAFVLCITADGVLASFSGAAGGQTGDITLTAYSTSIDAALLAPPAGATITTG
jgi:hypothetical protein